MIKRIGVLTGGGDAPGLNAVIRAVVRVAVGQLGWEVYGIEDGYEGLFEDDKLQPLTLNMVRGLLPRGGTILGTTNRGRFAPGPDFERHARDAAHRIQILGLNGLVVIGGEGSLTIGQAIMEQGGCIVAVPKTIDNDLGGTDLTFGFDTALDLATDAVDRLHTTAESHDRVMLVEVMGRHAGWIALYAGIAGGSDVILLPEIPFSIEAVADVIRQRDARGLNFSVVVVAEGAVPQGGAAVFQAKGRLGGIAHQIAAELEPLVGKEARVVVLGHLQRGGRPSASDRVLSSRLGAMAVRLIEQEAWGQMVALRGTEIVSIPIAEAVHQLKTVPPQGQLVQTARDLGISFGDMPG